MILDGAKGDRGEKGKPRASGDDPLLFDALCVFY